MKKDYVIKNGVKIKNRAPLSETAPVEVGLVVGFLLLFVGLVQDDIAFMCTAVGFGIATFLYQLGVMLLDSEA